MTLRYSSKLFTPLLTSTVVRALEDRQASYPESDVRFGDEKMLLQELNRHYGFGLKLTGDVMVDLLALRLRLLNDLALEHPFAFYAYDQNRWPARYLVKEDLNTDPGAFVVDLCERVGHLLMVFMGGLDAVDVGVEDNGLADIHRTTYVPSLE